MAIGQTVSRRSLANYAADQIIAGNSDIVLNQIAAYLVESKKTKDYDLVINDIESALAEKGSVLVKIRSARPLSVKSLNKIKDFIKVKAKAKHVELATEIDTSLIGGAIISTPDYVLDASFKNRLNKLKGINKE